MDANKLKKQYNAQRSQAKYKRHIDWQFTFETWLKKWIESGKLDLRGRGAGRYCMSRIGDTGPYSPSNTFIQLHTENTKQGQAGIHPRRCPVAINGMEFESISSAAKFHKVDNGSIHYWLKTQKHNAQRL